VFWAWAEAEETGGDSSEARHMPGEEQQGPGWPGSFGIKGGDENYAVKDPLQALDDEGGQCASSLHSGQVPGGDVVALEWFGQQGGGGDGILNGEVDADASDGAHGVCGVADEQQTVDVPAG